MGVMDERRNKIKSEFDYIENQKLEVKKLANEYEEKLANAEAKARIKIQEAIDEGRRISQEIQDESHQQAKEILHKAQIDVQREIGKVKMQLKNDLVEIAMAAAQKVIGKELDPNKQKQLVSEFIKEADFDR